MYTMLVIFVVGLVFAVASIWQASPRPVRADAVNRPVRRRRQADASHGGPPQVLACPKGTSGLAGGVSNLDALPPEPFGAPCRTQSRPHVPRVALELTGRLLAYDVSRLQTAEFACGSLRRHQYVGETPPTSRWMITPTSNCVCSSRAAPGRGACDAAGDDNPTI